MFLYKIFTSYVEYNRLVNCNFYELFVVLRKNVQSIKLKLTYMMIIKINFSSKLNHFIVLNCILIGKI